MTTSRRSLMTGAAASALAASAAVAAPSPFAGSPHQDLTRVDRVLVNDPWYGRPDYTAVPGHLLSGQLGDDAEKWAAAFCQIARKIGGHDIDEGWMISWFANAIECSHALRRERTLDPMQKCEDVARSDGNWNVDDYMHGYANGIILIHAIARGVEPEFLSGARTGLGPESRPGYRQLLDDAISATQRLADWTHKNESDWTGWGDQIVPPGATAMRHHAESALKIILQTPAIS